MAVRIGNIYKSLTGRTGETVTVEARSKEPGYVKLVVVQNGKELKTRKSVHVSTLMARTATERGFRIGVGSGEKVENVSA